MWIKVSDDEIINLDNVKQVIIDAEGDTTTFVFVGLRPDGVNDLRTVAGIPPEVQGMFGPTGGMSPLRLKKSS